MPRSQRITNLELVDPSNEVIQTVATRSHSFLVSSNTAYRFLSGLAINAVPLEAWLISHVHRLLTERGLRVNYILNSRFHGAYV